MQPIDTHVHAFKSDPAFTDLMERLQLQVLDICVADTPTVSMVNWPPTARARQGFRRREPRSRQAVRHFDPFTFQQKDFAQNTVKQLRQEFAEGAVAVKIWKNIGMELKTPDGRYVMPDDPAFATHLS